jgi:hypothetical protein
MARRRWSDGHLRGIVSACALLALTGMAGCAVNSEMIEVWHDPTFAPGSVHNVLVVGIRKDPVRRRLWEDAFVKALAARGLTATTSYQLFPEAPPDTQQVIEIVRKNGYDAVLVSIRLPNESSTRYVQGALRQERVTTQDYYGRFHSYWATVQDPGYTETDTVIQSRTELWVTAPDSGHLVSSGTLRTLESVNGRTVERAVSKDIMPELERQGVVPEKVH